MGSLGGLHAWEWPYEITSRGSRTEGFIGPVFFLAPLALLALWIPMGRQLLCAAAIFLMSYPAAIAAFEREIDPQWLIASQNRFEFALDKAMPPTPADPRELGIIVMKALLRN